MSTEVDLDQAIEQLRVKHGVPKALMDRMLVQESGGDDRAVSPVGARSRFQVMPATFDLYNKQVGGVLKPDNPLDNAYVGLRLLSDNYKRFRPKAKSDQHAWGLAIAGYHGSPDAVERDLAAGGTGIPDQGDGLINTRDHVYAILSGLKPEDFTSEVSRETLRPSVTSTVTDVLTDETPKPLAFEPEQVKDLGLSPLAQGSIELANRVSMQGIELPDVHPDRVGKPVELRFAVTPESGGPTTEAISDAFLRQYGYEDIGNQFKRETGSLLAPLSIPARPRIEGGDYVVTVRPTKGAIDAINAYASGGLEALRKTLEMQQMARGNIARDVSTERKQGQGLSRDIQKIGAETAIGIAQTAENARNLAMAGGPNYDPKWRNSEAIAGAQRALPQRQTAAAIPLEVGAGAVSTLTQAAALGPLGPAAFPAQQAITRAHEGPEASAKAALLTAPLMAAGPIARSVGADAMSPIERQLFMRGLGAGAQAGVTATQGGTPTDIARETLVGALFPIGGRRPPERPLTMDIGAARRPSSGIVEREPPIRETVTPETTPEPVQQPEQVSLTEKVITRQAALRDRLDGLRAELVQWQRAGGRSARGAGKIRALQQEIRTIEKTLTQANQSAAQILANERATAIEATRYSETPRFDEWVESRTGQRVGQVSEQELASLATEYRQQYANAPQPPAEREMPPLDDRHYSNFQPRRIRGEGKGQFKKGKPTIPTREETQNAKEGTQVQREGRPAGETRSRFGEAGAPRNVNQEGEIGGLRDRQQEQGQIGEPQTLYHFTTREAEPLIRQGGFDISKARARRSDEGVPDAVFFTPDPKPPFGDKMDFARIDARLKMEKPLRVENREALVKWARERDPEYRRLADAIAHYDVPRRIRLYQETQSDNPQIRAIAERENEALIDVATQARARLTELMKREGYDGLIMEKDEGGPQVTTTYAVLDPSQVEIQPKDVVDGPPVRDTVERSTRIRDIDSGSRDRKPLWEMTPEELQLARDAEISGERQMLTRYLGNDAQRFIDLNHQRLRGITGTDVKLNELTSRLTTEQQRAIDDWYAESEYRPSPDDYARHLENLRDIEGMSGSEENMAELMARVIPKLKTGEESRSKYEREQAALAESQIRYAAQVAREVGLDRVKLLRLTKERAGRLYGPDTEFMLEALLTTKGGSRTTKTRGSLPPSRNVVERSVEIRNAIDSSNLKEASRLLDEAGITNEDIQAFRAKETTGPTPRPVESTGEAKAPQTPQPPSRPDTQATRSSAEPVAEGGGKQVPPARGQAERSLPESLAKAGLSKGTDLYYNVKSHAETDAGARKLLSEQGEDGTLRRIMLADRLTPETVRAGQILIRRLDEQGRQIEADALADHMARKSTEAGQVVDAFSMIDERTPREIASYVERQVQKSNPAFKLDEGDRSTLEQLAADFQRHKDSTGALIEELQAKVAKLETKPPARGGSKPKTATLQARLDEAANAARQRLTERAAAMKEASEKGGGQTGASTIPQDIADYAIIGAAKLAKKGISVAQWIDEMAVEHGEWIREQWKPIWNESYRILSEQRRADRENASLRGSGADPATLTSAERQQKLRELGDRMQKMRASRLEMQHLYEDLNKSPWQKFERTVIDVAGIPRSLQTMGDLSFALRQNSVFALTEFKEGSKAFGKAIQAIGPEGYKQIVGEIASDPGFLKWRDGMKVEFTSPELRRNVGSLALREEAFQSTLAENIPGVGKVVQASERAFTAPLDYSRMVWADRFSKEIEAYAAESGWTPEKTQHALEQAGKFINVATGRGVFTGKFSQKLNTALPILNTVFFSPRYLLSRLQLMNMSLNPVAIMRLEAPVRKIVLRKMLRYYGTQAGIQVLAAGAGAGVNVDNPDSPDWLKLKVGNTRYDLGAGLQQNMRIMYTMTRGFAQLAAAEASGDQAAIDEAKKTIQNRAVYFLRSKLAPVPGLGVDWWKGKKITGEDFKWKEAALEKTVPLYVQDLYEAWKEEGGLGAAKATPGFVGVGVQTYKEDKRKPPPRSTAPSAPRPPRP